MPWYATLIAVLLLGIKTPAFALPHACQVRLYVKDPDPKGSNVREKPSASSRIVGVIRPPADPGDYNVVHVTRIQGGWAKIAGYSSFDANAPQPQFAIDGFVSMKLLGLETRIRQDLPKPMNSGDPLPLYEKPDTTSKAVSSVGAGLPIKVVGCSGTFVKLASGWLEEKNQQLNTRVNP